uniref:BTB domain-containing protein n=1 Tax=Setaria digitata TaxID=48799 RepID=A0A915PT92_9BILA
MDCFADDREALNDFIKYFNNAYLSDVTLLVGDEMCKTNDCILFSGKNSILRFTAHRIILTKSSEELELVEEPPCQRVFAAFLRFLYCNHVFLHPENALPILILADKYNVNSLKKVCIDYAVNNILPELSTRELFHLWFSYATKAFHQPLISACIKMLARHFEEMIISEEWEKEWLSVDRDQLIELLKSNDLVLPNEFRLWEAVQRWLMASSHPERRGNSASPLLACIIPFIKLLFMYKRPYKVLFPFMTADELTMVERSPLVEAYPKLFHPQILLAYKFQALPLASRVACKEFTGPQFILRNYTDVRWDKRITVPAHELRRENGYDRSIDQSYNITTRSSTFPLQAWNWKLKLASQLVPNSYEELRMFLVSDDIDQPRSIEYLIQIVDERKVVRSFSSKKNFTKTRYSADIEIEKKVDLSELFVDNSPLLVNGELHLQITLRPID